MSAIRVFLMYVHNYSEFRRDMKTRPLFGICPLFGVSVKREFTVFIIIITSEDTNVKGAIIAMLFNLIEIIKN